MMLAVDFIIAARIEAAERLELEKEDAANRVAERIAKSKEREKDGAEQMDQVLGVLLVHTTSARQRKELETRLATHQEAVVLALQANREALDRSEEHMDRLRDEAYRLEDGRLVFRSEDGTWVIDETGQLLSADEIDPDQIEDFRPSAETWLAAMDAHQALEDEQQALATYQQQLDEAQATMENGSLTQEDLDTLDDLLADAPASVQVHLPEGQAARHAVQNENAQVALLSDPAPAGPPTIVFGSPFGQH